MKKLICKKLLIAGAVTAFVSMLLLLFILSGQSSQTGQQMDDTVKDEESSTAELLQELSYVSGYLGQMDATVLTNQESLSTIANSNETFLSQSETLEQKISQIAERLNGFLISYETDDEEIRNQISDILARLEEAGEKLEESHAEIINALTELEDNQKNGQEKMQKNLEKIISAVDENVSSVKEKLEQSYEELTVILTAMKEEKTADHEEEMSFMEEIRQELSSLLEMEAGQLGSLIESESIYTQLIIDSGVQCLSGRMGDLHSRIVSAQDELSLLLDEMETGGEVRQEETKEAFASVKESLTLIQTDFTAAHEELKTLLSEVRQSSDEKHSELLLLLDQMESEMGESFQSNLTLFMESIDQMEKNNQTNYTLLMESMDQMGESSQMNSVLLMDSISQLGENSTSSFDSLKSEMTNAFQNMSDISGQISTLNSSLDNQYENLTTIVSTGDNDMRVYLDNIYDELTRKLDSVFQSVSSGKRLLASALFTKGVSCREDATFYEIYQALLSIPQQLDIGTQEMHAAISYDFHYHEDVNGINPHVERQAQMGGCYTIRAYHVHSGSTAGGGCYTTPAYHSHSGNSTSGGGCYTVAIAHSHNSSCPTKKVIANGGTATSCDGTFMYQSAGVYKCSRCGASSSSGGTCKAYNPHYETVYDCNKTVDSYNLGCGKTTSTVVSYNLGCGKSASTVDYYNAGCGFGDGQVSGVHILYSGNRAEAVTMNQSIRIPESTLETEELNLESEVPIADNDIEIDTPPEESIEQEEEELSGTADEAEEIIYEGENDD